MSNGTETWSNGDLFDDRYRLEEQIGSGTAGDVWRAEDTHRSHMVALKILANVDEDDAWREASRLTNLESPNILRVNNADLAIDVPYIDSVIALGGTAQDILSPLGMTPSKAVHLTRGALRGLQLCHEHRILHRDVKPANIFISDTGVAQLGDFGCAGLMAGDGSAKVKGDPDIRPLDTLKGAPWTASADVYGAGISLYAMITGSLPFSIEDAFAASPTDGWKAHCANVAGGIPDIRDVAPHVSVSLAKVIRKATSPKAVDRYKSAAELNTALAGVPALTTDTCRVTEAASGPVDHAGHDCCWLVRRRRDGALSYVCVIADGKKREVLVRRESGSRHRAWCKTLANPGACLVHLRRVFVALQKQGAA